MICHSFHAHRRSGLFELVEKKRLGCPLVLSTVLPWGLLLMTPPFAPNAGKPLLKKNELGKKDFLEPEPWRCFLTPAFKAGAATVLSSACLRSGDRIKKSFPPSLLSSYQTSANKMCQNVLGVLAKHSLSLLVLCSFEKGDPL